jgi:hypothetical protein
MVQVSPPWNDRAWVSSRDLEVDAVHSMGTDAAQLDPVGSTPAAAPPVLGWGLLASGALASIASFLTWQSEGFGGGLTGVEESDGWVSFWLGVVLATAGLLMIGHMGRRWVCAVAVLAAVVLGALFRLDENGLRHSAEAGVTVGVGLWLVGLAAVIGVVASLAGFRGWRPRVTTIG